MPSSIDCPICGQAKLRDRFRLKKFNVLACPVCTVMRLSEIPSEHDLEALYSNEYYESRSEYYFNNPVWDPEHGQHHENVASYKSALNRLRTLKPEGKTLLDVGCGLGIFLAMARDAGWDVKGVDTSAYAVRHGREHFKLDVAHSAVLKDAQYPANYFDVVTLWDSIEHFRDPHGQMAEVFRILKPGGVVMLDTPNGHSLMRVIANACYDATFGLFKYPVIKLYHQFHLFYYTPEALRRLMERAGFAQLTVEQGRIPIVKARGTWLEKQLVRVFSCLERYTGKAFELIMLARKPDVAPAAKG